MSSLLGFRLPSPGEVTVGERNGVMETVPYLQEKAALSAQGIQYPDVQITNETLRYSISKDSARSVFIEHNETLTKRLLHAWYEHGVDGVFEELASQKQAPRLARLAGIVLSAVRALNTLHTSLLPHHSMTREEMIKEFATCRNWSTSPIRAFAWHPFTDKFAVCLRDDSVRIYRHDKHDIVPVLKHKEQKLVAQLAWRPYSASHLAVACGSCVIVWMVDPTSLSTRPSSSLAQVLSQPGHCPVVNVAWSPVSALLVSSSPGDTAIMTWDLSTEQCTPIRRLGGGGVTTISWSPDESKLFSATPAQMFRVWDCASWTCERWTKLKGRCQAACWSPCGTVLLFATKDDFTVYSLQFPANDDNTSPPGSGVGSYLATACLNVTPCATESLSNHPSHLEMSGDHLTSGSRSDGKQLGGYVHSMCWDKTGQRLAIVFKDSESAENDYVALYRTRLYPLLEIVPCGLVSGLSGEKPCLINFHPTFEHGALLTVAWSSGRIGYVPLWFITSRDSPQPINVHLPIPPNGITTLYSTSS